MSRTALLVLVAVMLVGITSAVTEGRTRPRTGVAGQPSVVAISAGGFHACALMSDTTARCWGRNGSQVGDGSTTNRSHPVSVRRGNGQPLANLDAIAGRGFHTCAITSEGAIWCWGRNDWGQLGAGDTDPHVTAVRVRLAGDGLNDATAIAAGERHTCARPSDGNAWLWGSNDSGQLGRAGDSVSHPVLADAGAVAQLLHHLGAGLVVRERQQCFHCPKYRSGSRSGLPSDHPADAPGEPGPLLLLPGEESAAPAVSL